MIDFENAKYVKLREVDSQKLNDNIYDLLIPGERVINAYKGIRDYVVFTDLRFISVNVQGMTGKKQDFTSMPYRKISVFSVETAGPLDLDSELILYFSGVGKVMFEFTGNTDILSIGRLIAEKAL